MSASRRTRKVTSKILEGIEEGIFDKDLIIRCCLAYMSESDVADMARANELFDYEDEEEDE